MKNIFKFSLILVSCAIVLVYTFIQMNWMNVAINYQFESNNKSEIAYRNNYFMMNNNLMQYSAYLIVDSRSRSDEAVYRVESYVELYFQYIKKFENFTCVIKLVNIKYGYPLREEVIDMDPYEIPKITFHSSKKIVCLFKANDFESYRRDKRNFNVKRIRVAIIRKGDFSKEKTIEQMNFTLSHQTLPFNMINFQIPAILYPPEPRIPSVGLCVHYTHQMPTAFRNWLDMNLDFGIAEIMFYDATEGHSLTKIIKTDYPNDDRLVVRPFDINLEDLCNKEILFKTCDQLGCSSEMRDYLNKWCIGFYKSEFREKYYWRQYYEQVCVNECFTVLSNKYEFIAYYDLDEFVFPHQYNILDEFYNKGDYYKCKDKNKICNKKVMMNDFEANTRNYSKQNYMYNYLKYLLKKFAKDKDITKLRSFRFEHALLIKSDSIQQKLMDSLGLIIEKHDKNEIKFPTSIYLSAPPHAYGHIFLINKTDVGFIRYLHRMYTSLVPCIHDKYFKNAANLDHTLKRYVYYITEWEERQTKSIHYYKNVKTIYIHYSEDAVAGAWELEVPPLYGHSSPHFREDDSAIYTRNMKNHKTSVTLLNIEYEYMFYLLQKYSNFCSN